MRKLIPVLFAFIVVYSSCTVQHRVYRNGYYTERAGKSGRTAGTHNNDTLRTAVAAIPDSVAVLASDTPQKTIIVADTMPVLPDDSPERIDSAAGADSVSQSAGSDRFSIGGIQHEKAQKKKNFLSDSRVARAAKDKWKKYKRGPKHRDLKKQIKEKNCYVLPLSRLVFFLGRLAVIIWWVMLIYSEFGESFGWTGFLILAGLMGLDVLVAALTLWLAKSAKKKARKRPCPEENEMLAEEGAENARVILEAMLYLLFALALGLIIGLAIVWIISLIKGVPLF